MISVIIPTFNRYSLLKRAIKSILNQTYKDIEIIVVDDGSVDKTSNIKNDFNLTYIYQKNSGVSCARNKGIKKAKGEWIAFLDSDDTWCENKLQKQLTFLEKYPTIKFCHTGEKWIRENKEIKYPKRLKKPNGWCFYDNLQTCKIAVSSVIVHRDIFKEVGYFDEYFRVCEDYDFWLRISKKFEIGLIDEKLITKYAGDDQLSKTIKMIDLYHVKSLLRFKNDKKVRNVIEKKIEILMKGAKKYNNKKVIQFCQNIKKR